MIDTTISSLLGTSMLTGIVAVSPSVTVITPPEPILTVGVVSLSVILTVPEVVVFVTVPLVTVPFIVKVSFGSSVPSVVVGIEIVVDVSPAGIVAVTVITV